MLPSWDSVDTVADLPRMLPICLLEKIGCADRGCREGRTTFANTLKYVFSPSAILEYVQHGSVSSLSIPSFTAKADPAHEPDDRSPK